MSTESAQGIWLPLLAFVASWGIACSAPQAAPLQCAPAGIDEYAAVRYVIDGDTVVLADRRKVRLIGINAPEIGREGRRSQALAEPARGALKRLLTGQIRVGLQYDRQRRDRFGRQLSHLSLRDGTNVQAWLLERGFATALIFPPNLDYVECYRDAERAARESNLGLWRLARYKPVDAGRVAGLSRGYRVVTGRISGVGATRASEWLNFGPAFAVRIQRTDLHYFMLIGMLDMRQPHPDTVRHRPLNLPPRFPVRRPRRAKTVAVAIACVFRDGVLFCADTKITTGQEKSHKSKIYARTWGEEIKNGVTVFTLSGVEQYAVAAIEKCERAIAKLDFSHTSLDEIQDVIEAVLVNFYGMHIFTRQDSTVNFNLLIGLWLNGDTRVLSTDDTALRIVNGYECVGAGGYLARYWLRQALGPENRFQPKDLALEEASMIIEFAINNVVEYDESCGYEKPRQTAGGEAEYVGMRQNGEIGDIRQHTYLGEFPEELQSETWRLLRRLAKSQDSIDAEIECDTVRKLYEPVNTMLKHNEDRLLKKNETT